jgi:outer membrane protein assembly factor BamB
LLVAGCGHVAENARPAVYLDAVADAWLPVAHKPRWQLSFSSSAIDDAVFLDGSHVALGLLGTWQMANAGYPFRQSVSEIDVDTGTVVWRSIGAPLGGPLILDANSRRVLVNAVCPPKATCNSPTHHLYMLWDGPEVSAGNPVAKGRLRLESGVGPGAIALASDDKAIVTIGKVDQGIAVEGFKVDGAKKFLFDVDPDPTLKAARMVAGDQRIFVWRSSLAAYDTQTGGLLWKTAAPQAVTPGSQLFRDGGLLFAAHHDGRMAIVDEATGAVRGQLTGVRPRFQWVVRDSGLYELSADLRQILAFDRTTGARLFRRALPVHATGPIAVGDGVVAVPTGAGVAFYSATDGEALEVVPVGLVAPEHHILDRLSIHGHQVVIATETGVAAIDLGTRKLLWSYQVRGLPPPFLVERVPQVRFQLSDFGVEGVKDLPSIMALQPAAGPGASAVSLDPIKGNGPGGAFDVGNSGTNAALNALAGSANLSLGVIEMNLELAREAAEFHAAETNALIANAKLRLLYALDVFMKSIQGDYYVMPIGWLWGDGYFIVDLRSGNWTEVVTGPRQHFEDALSVDYPLGVISPKGDFLLTCALGFDRQTWFEKTLDPKKVVFPAADEPRRLMRFDIDPAAFAPRSDYPAKSIVDDRVVPGRR